jgi:hypothetical protein
MKHRVLGAKESQTAKRKTGKRQQVVSEIPKFSIVDSPDICVDDDKIAGDSENPGELTFSETEYLFFLFFRRQARLVQKNKCKINQQSANVSALANVSAEFPKRVHATSARYKIKRQQNLYIAAVKKHSRILAEAFVPVIIRSLKSDENDRQINQLRIIFS